MAIHAFIADIAPPDQRAFRIAMVQLAQAFPRPICPLIAAALYKKGKISFRSKPMIHPKVKIISTISNILLKL